MKEREKKDRGGPPTGSRTGPRARAFQQRTFGDPYQRAERPERGEFASGCRLRSACDSMPMSPGCSGIPSRSTRLCGW